MSGMTKRIGNRLNPKVSISLDAELLAWAMKQVKSSGINSLSGFIRVLIAAEKNRQLQKVCK